MRMGRALAAALVLLLHATGACQAQEAANARGETVSQRAETASGPAALQAQLAGLQAQAQRHLGQLNGLVLSAANLSQCAHCSQSAGAAGGAATLSPVLAALANVRLALQQQAAAAKPSLQIVGGLGERQAQSKQNEYQLPALEQANGTSGSSGNAANAAINKEAAYREQGEQLRREIGKRVAQLQQVVGGSMELVRNNSDLIVRRLLDQMSVRLDQAKSKADRILSEPATSEVALRALATINLGLNNLNNMITNIVARLEASASAPQGVATQPRGSGAPADAQPAALLAQQAKLRHNLHQLGHQFHSALNATGSQLGPLVRQRQQQIQLMLSALQQQQQKGGPALQGGQGGALSSTTAAS